MTRAVPALLALLLQACGAHLRFTNEAPASPLSPSQPAPRPLLPKPGPISSLDVNESKLFAHDGASYQHFGSAMAQHGGRLAVSTDSSHTGQPSAVYLFQQQPQPNNSSSYVPLAKLQSWSGSDGYGLSLAMSPTHLAVGAPHDDHLGYLAGRVYVYPLGGPAGAGRDPQLLHSRAVNPLGGLFGSTLALHGGLLAVGAPMEMTEQQFAGMVYLFSFNASTKTWVETARLADDVTGSTYHRFGACVHLLSASSLAVAATGYTMEGLNIGAVFFYSRTKAAIEGEDQGWAVETRLTPTFLHADAAFGYAMAFDSDVALISARSDTHGGVVYAYRRSSSLTKGWVLQQVLTPSGPASATSAFGQVLHVRMLALATNATNTTNATNGTGIDAGVGNATAIVVSHYYRVAIVGAPGDRAAGVDAGAVYVFAQRVAPPSLPQPAQPAGPVEPAEHDSTVPNAAEIELTDPQASGHPLLLALAPAPAVWQLVGKVTGNDTQALAAYGHSVLCDASGNALVGAILANSPVAAQAGAVYVEHGLAAYLVARHFAQLDSGEDQDGDSEGGGALDAFRKWVTSAGAIAGLACLPAAAFVVFVLLQAHRAQIGELFKTPPVAAAHAYDPVVLGADAALLKSHDGKVPSSTGPAPLEQVIRVLLNQKRQGQGPSQDSPQGPQNGDGLLPRARHALQNWLFPYARLPSRAPAPPVVEIESLEAAGQGESKSEVLGLGLSETEVVESPLVVGSGPSHLGVMAAETEARKRDLLDRMHKLMNQPDQYLMTMPKRRRSESAVPPGDERGTPSAAPTTFRS